MKTEPRGHQRLRAGGGSGSGEGGGAEAGRQGGREAGRERGRVHPPAPGVLAREATHWLLSPLPETRALILSFLPRGCLVPTDSTFTHPGVPGPGVSEGELGPRGNKQNLLGTRTDAAGMGGAGLPCGLPTFLLSSL